MSSTRIGKSHAKNEFLFNFALHIPGAANLPSTSANTMMNQPVGGIAQQNAAAIGIGTNQNLAQRQQTQNPSMMMNQGMGSGNMNALQQMKQNQQQLGGNNVFAGGAGMAQQRQVSASIYLNMKNEGMKLFL